MMPDDFKIIHADGTVISFNNAKEVRSLSFAMLWPLSYEIMSPAERELWLALGGSKDHKGEQNVGG